MRFKLRGEWGYTPFKLEESDKPYLTALKFTCPQQYEALMAVSEELTLTYEQIAVQLKCPVNTLKTRTHRARSKIKAWRKEHAPRTS